MGSRRPARLPTRHRLVAQGRTAAQSPPFASPTAAKNWAQDAKVDLRRGVRRAPAPMTVHQLAEVWPELGQYQLAELDHDVVQDMIERLLSGGADDKHRKKSASTVRNAITALRAMWRHPAARKSQPGTPWTGWRCQRRPRGATGTQPPGEAATPLAVLPRADQAIWGTALYAGLRPGELLGLRTSDVDVATGVIRVEQAYDPRSKRTIPPKSYAATARSRLPDCSATS